LTSQSGTSGSIDISNYHAYIGIRVWKRNNAGTETEITDGSPHAIAAVPSSSGIVFAYWSCPQTSLATTDAIVVRVYASDGSTWVLLDTWVTEQLGATQLDGVQWTVYYYIYVVSKTGVYNFRFDTTTYNSRITNFSWSIVSKTWHDVAVWSFQLLTRKWNNISTFALTLQTRAWHETTWTFQLQTQKWHEITSWIFQFATKKWNSIAYWTWQTITYGWHTITEWTFTLITHGWHTITLWHITIGGTDIPILFIGLLFFAAILCLTFILAHKTI